MKNGDDSTDSEEERHSDEDWSLTMPGTGRLGGSEGWVLHSRSPLKAFSFF